MNRPTLGVYLVYALLAPSLPLVWPVPPLDLYLLLAGVLANREMPVLVTMLGVDLVLGQPVWIARWAAWLVILGLLTWRRAQLGDGRLAGLVLGVVWYYTAGPALSLWAAAAVALQGVVLLAVLVPKEVSQRGPGWGWH